MSTHLAKLEQLVQKRMMFEEAVGETARRRTSGLPTCSPSRRRAGDLNHSKVITDEYISLKDDERGPAKRAMLSVRDEGEGDFALTSEQLDPSTPDHALLKTGAFVLLDGRSRCVIIAVPITNLVGFRDPGTQPPKQLGRCQKP
eukprot:3598229-Amphidinium_carterae.1